MRLAPLQLLEKIERKSTGDMRDVAADVQDLAAGARMRAHHGMLDRCAAARSFEILIYT